MGLKSISIVLFGLALCCFLAPTSAQDDNCILKFWADKSIPTFWNYREQGEGGFSKPFDGWYDFPNINMKFNSSMPSLSIVQKNSSYCDYCVFKAFEKADWTGTKFEVDFRDRIGDDSQVSWSFYAYSYSLQCFPPELPEEEEIELAEEEEVEVPEEEEYIEEEEEEEEESDLSEEYKDPIFQQMNEGDGETLPYLLIELRHNTVQLAVTRLVNRRILPQGKYTVEKIYSTEFATNYEDIWRFNVMLRDENGVDFRIWFVSYCFINDPEVYLLVDAGYKENRLAEFANTDFKVLDPNEESQAPYPREVQDLGQKAVKQAAKRLVAKKILPQDDYSIFLGFYFFTIVEHSTIVNMTEYPDQNDMLYRFNARVVDMSGRLYRIWAVIATNYEVPEYYELIDYGYRQSRLSDFPEIHWNEMPESEDEPLPGAVADMRSRAVAQAIPRLQAEGLLPAEGQFTMTHTYTTEQSQLPYSPDFQAITSQPGDMAYQFTVQVSNEAGARFRIAVVGVNNLNFESQYELLDYFLVENKLDQFSNIKFVTLDDGDLATKSINQAVDRLIGKSVIPAGQYSITKKYPTEFASKFEHPYYSADEDILYNFTAQVKNAAGTDFKVYAIVITDYEDPTDYELIDYGKI